jgi:predicted permease
MRTLDIYEIDTNEVRDNPSRVYILNVAAPVLVMLALGAFLAKVGMLSPRFCREANRLNYLLGVPVLIFTVFSETVPADARVRSMLAILPYATGLAVLCTCLTVILFRSWPILFRSLVQRGFHEGFVFVILPIALAFPDRVVGPQISMHQAAIILLLLLHQALDLGSRWTEHSGAPGHPFLSLGRQAASSPPFLATLGIGLYLITGWDLPDAINSTFRMILMVIPFGALCSGGVYAERPWPRFQR